MLAPGHCIAGRYRLIRRLGLGGMGEVWHARNEAVERDFAIKILLGTPHDDGPAKRLLREGRAAGRLRHPNIVEIFDASVDPDLGPYLVMELLDGNSLADALQRSRSLPLEAVVGLGATIAAALRVAHHAGVIHRDLKAANVFLHRAPSGVVPKLVDFGISKVREVSDDHVTLDGAVLGSPLGMSPEQAMGRGDVDHRTDIWSLGALLYRMLTGRNPFRGATPAAVMRAIIMDDLVPPRELAEAPAELHALIERCLRKEREDRPSTALEVEHALTTIAEYVGLPPMNLEPLLGDDHERTRERTLDASIGSETPPMRTAETPAMLPLPAPEPATTVEAPRRPGRRKVAAVMLASVLSLSVIVSIAVRWSNQPSGAAGAPTPLEIPRAEPSPSVSAALSAVPSASVSTVVAPAKVTPTVVAPKKPPVGHVDKPLTVVKKPTAPTKPTASTPDPTKHADF